MGLFPLEALRESISRLFQAFWVLSLCGLYAFFTAASLPQHNKLASSAFCFSTPSEPYSHLGMWSAQVASKFKVGWLSTALSSAA